MTDIVVDGARRPTNSGTRSWPLPRPAIGTYVSGGAA